MEKKISTLVGCLNNLDYTQHFYKTFREIYPTEELVFVSYGSTDGTHIWLKYLDDSNVKSFYFPSRKTFSDTYNKCIELATKEYVVFAHNDMVVADDWLENIEKHLHPQSVVSYTTIEPPIFSDHERPGKIIKDFGSDIQTFNSNFYPFVDQEQEFQNNKTEPGITFFMALSRQVLLDIGGFDNIFNPYFSEDDDLIRRLKYQKLNCFTSLDSIVYHFVSKTSRFSEEAKLKTKQIEQNSNKIYLEKWSSYNSENRFNVGFIIENCTNELLHNISPWADNTYVDIDVDWEKYPRIKPFENEKNNDIFVSFDAQMLDNNQFEIIKNLQNILGNVTKGERYEIGIFTIEVINPINYIKELIFIHK